MLLFYDDIMGFTCEGVLCERSPKYRSKVLEFGHRDLIVERGLAR
jgi:hypothetical protein